MNCIVQTMSIFSVMPSSFSRVAAHCSVLGLELSYRPRLRVHGQHLMQGVQSKKKEKEKEKQRQPVELCSNNPNTNQVYHSKCLT